MVLFLVGGNPADFQNVCSPFSNIGCTTLSHDGSQEYYHRYCQILAQAFWGCCVLVLCSVLEEGMHKTYLRVTLPVHITCPTIWADAKIPDQVWCKSSHFPSISLS